MRQFSRPAERIASLTRVCAADDADTSGSRTSGDDLPSNEAAYFTGAGLVSTNSASCRAANRILVFIAPAVSPFSQASCISAQARGAMLAVTEMHPSPPLARYDKAVASSPDSMQNASPHVARVLSARAKSFVASLTPTMFGSFASRAMVSTFISTTQRPGIL